jgi:hypothetical protein
MIGFESWQLDFLSEDFAIEVARLPRASCAFLSAMQNTSTSNEKPDRGTHEVKSWKQKSPSKAI